MAVKHNAKHWKRGIKIALALLLAADTALLVFLWRAAAAPGTEAEELQRVRMHHELLGNDVRRAQGIRERLPEIAKEADEFFEKQFRPAGEGYSAIAANLDGIARRAGLSISELRFRQQDIEQRGIVEVQAEASIEGNYAGLVRFINGIERSEQFYVLESLTLERARGDAVTLRLGLKTYFRGEPRT